MSRELLQQARDALCSAPAEFLPLIKEIDVYLSQPDWIRVEDALPVVPDGKSHVAIWCGNSKKGEIWRSTFLRDGKMHRQATHWQPYTTPQPPEGIK